MAKDKNILITGATKGIGLACVELLAASGANISFCSRTAVDVDKLLNQLKSNYPNQSFIGQTVDVTNAKQLASLTQSTELAFGHIDVLINNAGVFLPGKISDEPEGNLMKQLEVNLVSAYNLTRLVLPKMIQDQSGHIINMCSIASKIAYPNGGSYSISKFALYGMTKVLREEVKADQIRVTAILPGATWSNSWAGVDLPIERLISAKSIAEVVALSIKLDNTAVLEDIVIRPQLGDL